MLIDPQRLEDITRGKPELIASLAQMFLGELPQMLDSIEAARDTDSRESLAEQVHRLKSAIGNFASAAFYNQIAQLEKQARAEDSDRWSDHWQECLRDLQRFSDELKLFAGI